MRGQLLFNCCSGIERHDESRRDHACRYFWQRLRIGGSCGILTLAFTMKQSPQGPQPTDIAEKLIAYRRRTASKSKAKDSDPEHSKPQRKQLAAPEIDDFRRMNISSSSPRQTKLFNPERDPIPTIRRTTEPEVMPDAASSRNRPDSSPRHLFDHRKDDPVRFSVLARPPRPTPTPKSSGDYVSASSTSSYAPSQTSSTFTLSSTTDGSSASSALFDNQGKPNEDQGTSNVFALQLKKLYRAITNLEAKIKQEDVEESELANEGGSRIMLKSNKADDDELEREKWKSRISDHKRLVSLHLLIYSSLIHPGWLRIFTISSRCPSHPPLLRRCETSPPNTI